MRTYLSLAFRRPGEGDRIDTVARRPILGLEMRKHLARALAIGIAVLGPLAAAGFAEPLVTVIASANAEYTQHKYDGGKTASETYVVRPGQFVGGNIADGSLDHMPFRRVAEALAPELARREYWPAKDAKDADLLLVVHWGSGAVQWPLRVPPFLVEETVPGNRGKLLMDSQTIPSRTPPATAAEVPGNIPDYFISLEAYDLHAATAADRNRAVWTLDLRVPSPGNDFATALKCMSAAAADYAGRSTEELQHVRPQPPANPIKTRPVVILTEDDRGAVADHAGT